MLHFRVARIIVYSLAALVFGSIVTACSTAADTTNLPKSLTIMGQPLTLKNAQGGGPGQPALAEYIPEGETLDNWTTMFAIRFVPGATDAKGEAAKKAQFIKDRKASGQDELANVAVFESKDGQSVNADFLISTATPQVTERNVWRYFQGKGGVSSYQIAQRIYGTKTNQDQVAEFIKNIPSLRGPLFTEITRPDLPHWPS